MLVDINLLPPKPPKNIANQVTILLTLIGVLLILTYLFQEGIQLQRQAQQIQMETQIVEIETIRIEEELAMLEATQSDIITQQNIVETLNNTVRTTQVIEAAKNHLPIGATVLSYRYTNAQNLTLRIRVDETPKVGNFVETLNATNWVNLAEILNVTLETGTGDFIGEVTIELNSEVLKSLEWRVSP